MTVFAVLTAEEAAIAIDGELPEPSFRPWPDSAREREQDEEWERRRVANDGVDIEDVDTPTAGALRPFARRDSVVFSRHVAAERWKRYGVTGSLIVTSVAGAYQIIGLGTVDGGTRERSRRGVRTADYQIGRVLREPLPLAAILAELPEASQNRLSDALGADLRPAVPSQVAAAVEEARPGITAELAEVVREARERRARQRPRKRTSVAVREAAATALHLFTSRWHELSPVADPAPTALASAVEELLSNHEVDAITDDAGVFPGWDRSMFSRGGWWEFRYKARRLLVKNINASPAETATGADLVYVKRAPDTIVLVQYKMATVLADGRLIYRPDARLPSQVTRMISYDKLDRGALDGDDPETYRLGDGYTFVKFVANEATRVDRPGGLSPGRYMPSEYVRRMLARPGVGPGGGSVHYLEQHRSLAPETFAQLVRGSWIGSTGEASRQLLRVLDLPDSSDVVLAVDEPIT